MGRGCQPYVALLSPFKYDNSGVPLSMSTLKDNGNQAADEVINLRQQALENAGLTFDRIARELRAIALSDIADYVTVDEGGALQAIPLEDITKRKRAAIRKIKEKTNISKSKDGETIFKTSTIEYELYDKLGAIEKVLKLRNDYPAEKLELEALTPLVVFDDGE